MKNYGMTFNDIGMINSWDLLSEPYSLLEVDEPATPALIYNSVVVPGKDGEQRVPDRYDNKDVVVVVEVRPQDGQTPDHHMRALLGQWVGRKAKLMFGKHPDLYYWGQMYDEVDKLEMPDGTYQLSITFNVEPFLYKDGDTTESIGVRAKRSVSVDNTGDYYAVPTFILDGNATSITITVEGGAAFTFKNLSSETVVVDCERMVVYTDNGTRKESKLLQFSGVFPAFKPGVNTYTITGSGMNLDVITEYRNRYRA